MNFSRFKIVLIVTLAVGYAGCEGKDRKIHVSTTPAGAAVYCNNQKLGTSPVSVTLPARPKSMFSEIFIIEARLPGYEPAREYLTEATPGSLAGRKVSLTLPPLPAGMTDSDIPAVGKYIPPGMPTNYLSRVACEIMLVRVSDGRVLSQASGMVCDDFLARLSDQLTRIIKRRVPPGPFGTLAVCQLRNRRETSRGQGLADKLTTLISREMSFNSPRGLAIDIDLRTLVSESKIDQPGILKKHNVRDKLHGIEYVIIGGLAETIVP